MSREQRNPDDAVLSNQPRRDSRYPKVNFVWFHLLGKEGNAPDAEGICKMTDLSENGIGILLTTPLKRDSRIFLSINTKSENICLCGRVVYSRPVEEGFFRAGIEFEMVPPQHRMFLKLLGRKDE